MKNTNKKVFTAIIIFIVLLAVGGSMWISAINTRKKSEIVFNEQIALQAQKASEDKVRLVEQIKYEEERMKEEQWSLDHKLNKKQKHELSKRVQVVSGIHKPRRIPVLMYHSIDYERGNELRIPKEKFREQMKYLKDNNFSTLNLDELYSHMISGTELPEKPIVITLDDGYDDNYTNAYPVLKEFGQKAVVFMITTTIDTDSNYLTSEQIKEMDSNGMNIESHTVNHPMLNQLSYDKQVKELKQSKEVLENLLGREMKYIAYPYGKFNNDTLKAAQDIGYKMAFSTQSGLAEKNNGILKLHRIYISEKYSLNQFKQLVNMK